MTKHPDTLPDVVSPGDRLNMVFKGTSVAPGAGRAIVTATGMDTEMGAIARMLDATVEEPTPLQTELNRLGKMLGLIVTVIAIVVMLTIILVNGVSTPRDLVMVLLLGVSLAVAAVPEGPPAILSVVLAIGVQRMASRHAIVKKLNSVEALGSASVICTDKTGTLTRNEMTIERVVTASGRADVTGLGYRPDGEFRSVGYPLGATAADASLHYETQLVLVGGSLSNNAQLTERDGHWNIQGDPTEAAFLVAAHKLADTTGHVDRFERHAEMPFTSVVVLAIDLTDEFLHQVFHRDDPVGAAVLVEHESDLVVLAAHGRESIQHGNRSWKGQDRAQDVDERRPGIRPEIQGAGYRRHQVTDVHKSEHIINRLPPSRETWNATVRGSNGKPVRPRGYRKETPHPGAHASLRRVDGHRRGTHRSGWSCCHPEGPVGSRSVRAPHRPRPPGQPRAGRVRAGATLNWWRRRAARLPAA